MTTLEISSDAPVAADDVEHSRSAACWSVEERAWKQDLPDLPDDMIALLAAPVVVSASTWSGQVPLARESGEDDASEERPERQASPCATADRTPRFLAPAPPLRSVQRAVRKFAAR